MMQSDASTPKAYMDALPDDRKAPMRKLRAVIRKNLPKGFQEQMPFMNLASQKNFIAVYHMGIYSSPELLEWFTAEYAARVKGRLDMGKSCIRFKKINDIPVDLIGELCTKLTVDEWIEFYESARR